MENIIQIVIAKYHPVSAYTIINTPVLMDKVSDVQYNDMEKYHTIIITKIPPHRIQIMGMNYRRILPPCL